MVLGRKSRNRIDDHVRTTVAVHTRDGKSIAGVLLEVYEDCVSLGRARLLSESAGQALPLDGETLIPLKNIAFIQSGIVVDDTRHLRALARGRETA